MIRTKRKGLTLGLATLMTTVILGGCQGNGGSNGKVKLSFQIWDTAQRNGMKAVANACMERHPDVEINVQITSWDEYWTKLDTAAESNQLPDIFWVHTSQILKYADYGMLTDVTDLYDDVGKDYYTKHFSETSLRNAKGSGGRLYGVPKDKDSVCLVYSRKMSDAVSVVYPGETWTWDGLAAASARVYEDTGKYGFVVYTDKQLGYWNFVYQTGGYMLNEDKTRAGLMDEGTREGMEFYVNLQEEPWYPDQNYFAETNPGMASASEQGAMYLEGNWDLISMMENNRDIIGEWDVAIPLRCPDPVRGDGRASTSNGLRHATGARGKKLEYTKDFLEFAGSEKRQRVQGLSGAAIPAYIGLGDTWIHVSGKFDYMLDTQKCVDMLKYSVRSANNASCPNWKAQISNVLLKIYGGQQSLDGGLVAMQKLVDEAKQP